MSAGTRRPYIDWARGLAVLLMIEAHIFDAWTNDAARSTLAYRNLMILGGFAAPLFLWLAGVAAMLSVERAMRRHGDRRVAARALCRRGGEIFLLAFLFRLQAFILSPGNPLVSLLRVDILNVMGPSIVLTGLIWWAFGGRTLGTLALAIAAAAVAVATPLVRPAAWVSNLPALAQWYIRPDGPHTTFTLFPWSGFVLAGGATGLLIVAAQRAGRESRLYAGLAASGCFLAGLGFYAASRPPLFGGSSFWTTSPEFFGLRTGVLMVGLALAYGLEEALRGRVAALEPLARLGRASLFVYWIHVEMVYGYLSWPLHRNLPLPAVVVAYASFCALMFGAVVVRDRIVKGRQNRSGLDRPAWATGSSA